MEKEYKEISDENGISKYSCIQIVNQEQIEKCCLKKDCIFYV